VDFFFENSLTKVTFICTPNLKQYKIFHDILNKLLIFDNFLNRFNVFNARHALTFEIAGAQKTLQPKFWLSLVALWIDQILNHLLEKTIIFPPFFQFVSVFKQFLLCFVAIDENTALNIMLVDVDLPDTCQTRSTIFVNIDCSFLLFNELAIVILGEN